MKKALSVLSLIAILGMATPVMAAPGGPGGPGGHGGPPRHGGGHVIHAGHHHRPPMMHHRHHHHGYYGPHGGVYISTGYPRHSYWSSYGAGYWGGPWCDYRLAYYDPYMCPPPRPYVPMANVGFSVRF